MREFVENIY